MLRSEGAATLGSFSQVSDSSGPLKQWPRGHRTLALSSGPSVEDTVYRYSTAAGRPHLAVPCLSMYSGQSINITLSIGTPVPFGGCKSVLADSEWTHGAADTPGWARP
jgi:hypothetical protein